MAETKHISATINTTIADGVQEISEKEKRSFSKMVEMLLEEALAARSPKKSRNKRETA